MIKHLRTRKAGIILGITGVDILFFGFSNPSTAPSVLLIVGFLLAVITIYWLLQGVRYLLRLYYPNIAKRPHAVMAATAVIGIVLALQSIGQLTTRDFILFPLAGLAVYGYLTYLKKQPQT